MSVFNCYVYFSHCALNIHSTIQLAEPQSRINICPIHKGTTYKVQMADWNFKSLLYSHIWKFYHWLQWDQNQELAYMKGVFAKWAQGHESEVLGWFLVFHCLADFFTAFSLSFPYLSVHNRLMISHLLTNLIRITNSLYIYYWFVKGFWNSTGGAIWLA